MKLPKIVVVVDKDDTGKLWNYISTQEEWVRNRNSFETSSLWIHKPDSSDNRCVRPTEPTEEDHVTLGLLLPYNEVRAHTRIKKK